MKFQSLNKLIKISYCKPEKIEKKKLKIEAKIEHGAMENEYLGASMEQATDIGSDALSDVLEGSVVPLRMSRISPKGLRCRRLGWD